MIEASEKEGTVIELEIPAKPRYVGVVRLIASSLARMQDFREEAIDDLKIAISELCTNAIIHTSNKGGLSPVVVRYITGDDFIQVEVQDNGPGFDAACVGRLRENGLVEKGYGIPLIKSLVDEFFCDSDPATGTRIRITKYRE